MFRHSTTGAGALQLIICCFKKPRSGVDVENEHSDLESLSGQSEW